MVINNTHKVCRRFLWEKAVSCGSSDKIAPEINAKVEDTLNDWFGVEYELVK